MGKIFYLMGKSSSGKDTIFQEIKKKMPMLRTVTLYTTRPMREGEKEGREYFFTDEETLRMFLESDKVIELREYQTIHGIWKYFTADDGQICLDDSNYLMIGTLDSYGKMRAYFGEEKIMPVYVEVEDGERLMRALQRERMQEEPKYAEMCRRFLADTEDFSEEKIRKYRISARFENTCLDRCLEEIMLYIRNNM
ncbi:guanylate kinase [Drancourtella sp. An210]|nr:guanylate kinase [uncultured Sellimonas sp.]OUO98815.1 guanylate kinase [Drancourtella sp. An210]